MQPYIHQHPMVLYALNKSLCTPDQKMYNLVCAACGFFNLLKVDMFLNPTNIKLARDVVNNSLLHTPEGEQLDQFHGLPHMNPSFVLLNVRYPMNCCWKILRNAFRFNYVFTSLHIHFKNVLCLRTGLLQTISMLFQLQELILKLRRRSLVYVACAKKYYLESNKGQIL